MYGDARDFNNETRDVNFFFLARHGAEGNSHHFDRNIKGTCTIVCYRQKLVIFPPVMRFVLDDLQQ
jgi:hypothetical protein